MPEDEKQKQFKNLHENALQAKELENEYKYKRLFVDLISTKKSQIITAMGNSDDYVAETKVLKKLLGMERDVIFASLTVGLVAFATIRYLPHVAIRIIGGESRLKALKEAEIKAKSAPNARLKSIGSFLFESTLGFWASYRGYHVALNMKSDDVYHDLVDIPLLPGRSKVSEVICKDWSNIVKYQIPKEFWRNVQNPSSQLKEEGFFKAVLEFEEACLKRKRYEDLIRKRNALNSENPVAIPEPGVPLNIFELSVEELNSIIR